MSRLSPRSWPNYGPPLVAALVTFLLSGFVDWLSRGEYSPDGISSLLPLLLLPLPFVVSALWAGVQMLGLPGRTVLLAAGAFVGVGLVQFSPEVVLQTGGQMAAGIVTGMALQYRWRLDMALVLAALALTPALIWATLEMPPREQFQLLGDQVTEVYQGSMPNGADEKQQALALEEQRRQWDDVTRVGEQLYPAAMAVGVLGQAGVTLALVWLLARPLGLVVGLTGLRPFLQWRVPFYVVWMLVVGIGLFLTRQAFLIPVGITLMVLAAMLISVHGFAIQVFLTSRVMFGPGKMVFWLVMGVFFWFVLLLSGLLLGLADQWIDLRRHIAAAGPPSDGQR